MSSSRPLAWRSPATSTLMSLAATSDGAGDRSALTRLLADAAAGKFSALVIVRLDRLGRTIPAAAQVLADLDTAGVCV